MKKQQQFQQTFGSATSIRTVFTDPRRSVATCEMAQSIMTIKFIVSVTVISVISK